MNREVELCEHVTLRILERGEESEDAPSIVEFRGLAHPYFGWDPDLGADVPRVECSHCKRSAKIMGRAVRPRPRAGDYVPF